MHPTFVHLAIRLSIPSSNSLLKALTLALTKLTERRPKVPSIRKGAMFDKIENATVKTMRPFWTVSGLGRESDQNLGAAGAETFIAEAPLLDEGEIGTPRASSQ